MTDSTENSNNTSKPKKAKKLKRPFQHFDHIEVWWDDASELEQGWEKDFDSTEYQLALTRGFNVFEDEEHLVLCLDCDGKGFHNGRSQIPKGMIKYRKVLRKKDVKKAPKPVLDKV